MPGEPFEVLGIQPESYSALRLLLFEIGTHRHPFKLLTSEPPLTTVRPLQVSKIAPVITFPQNYPSQRSAGPNLPQSALSYSGLTRAGHEGHLVVHDHKAEGPRLSLVPDNGNSLEEVEIDWSRTDRPEDLEAVSDLDGQSGQYMAVEGSRYNGRTPHLFLFNYADGKADTLEQFDLPPLPYEIEGMVTKRQDDGDIMVVLGGRGDGENSPGLLHWGTYDTDERRMTWDEKGLAGVPVSMPEDLGPGGRPISDLFLNSNGDLWAAGCTDNGDEGPFESLIYRVGRLDSNAANPVTLTVDQPVRVPGEKIEGLSTAGLHSHQFVIGTDNESFGGSLRTLSAQAG